MRFRAASSILAQYCLTYTQLLGGGLFPFRVFAAFPGVIVDTSAESLAFPGKVLYTVGKRHKLAEKMAGKRIKV